MTLSAECCRLVRGSSAPTSRVVAATPEPVKTFAIPNRWCLTILAASAPDDHHLLWNPTEEVKTSARAIRSNSKPQVVSALGGHYLPWNPT